MKTTKIRIYPNKKQRELIEKTIGCCRFVYNWALAKKIEFYQQNHKSLHKYKICNELLTLKEEKEWLKEVNSQSLQHSIFRLEQSYNQFFKKNCAFPKFKAKHKSAQSFEVPQKWKLDDKAKSISLPKIGWMRFRDKRSVSNLKIKTIQILKSSTNKYFACLVCETPEFPSKIKSNSIVGIDLGLKTYATFSDGTKIDHPNTMKNHLLELQKINQKYSENKTENNRLRLSKKYEKIKNCRLDFLHKLTTQIAENQSYDTVVIEDLDVSGMVGDIANVNRKITDSSFFKFRTLLEYKLADRGKNLIIIGRFEPSSKACECGYINQELTLDDRTWTCPQCNITHDRDILAANNIKRWGTPLNIL